MHTHLSKGHWAALTHRAWGNLINAGGCDDSSLNPHLMLTTPAPRYNARMNALLKITKIGNRAGAILPKNVLAHRGPQVGDLLSLVTTPHGIELAAAEADTDA